MPTQDELQNLQVHWLTADSLWEPSTVNESLDDMFIVPFGYFSVLGEIDLKTLSLDAKVLGRVGEMGELEEFSDVKINKEKRFIILQKITNQEQKHEI